MSDTPMQEFWVARDADRLGEHLGNSISDFFFKVSTEDSHGGLLVVEMTHHAKGGPGRHFHYDQDEWFYVVEGEYVLEVGQERIRLKPAIPYLDLAKCHTSGHLWVINLEESYLS